MSDAERTEKPTARALRRARERGDVPRSPLLSAALALIGITVALFLGGDAAIAAWQALVRDLWVADPVSGSEALQRSLAVTAAILAPALALVVGLGALGAFLQVGPLFTGAPLRPDLGRLDPARGAARLFSGRALASRLGGLPLALGVAALAVWIVLEAWSGLLGRTDLDAARVMSAGATLGGAFLSRACALLAAGAAVAVVYARWRWWRDLHMTRRELLRELRETEGEPMAKRRRARAHRERAMGPSLQEARERAAIVIASPEVAVAVGWTDRDAAPTVLHVARGEAAAELGRGGAPVLRDAGLAAGLAEVEPGRAVPRALFARLARALVAGGRTDALDREPRP